MVTRNSACRAARLVLPAVLLLSSAGLGSAGAESNGQALPETPAAARVVEGVPHLSHAPVARAAHGEELVIRAEITYPERVRRAVLVVRSADGLREVQFLRSSDEPYAATIPASEVRAPTLAYAIELELTDGSKHAVFASRARPHVVQVPEDLMDLRERALLERLGGRRSVFSASADNVSFGKSLAEVRDPTTNAVRQEEVRDGYFRVEAMYTYRPLRFVTEFSVRAGVVRGKAPVSQRDPLPGQSEDERFDVGLNYGAPRVRLRAHDIVHFEGELLTSVTEVGFSWGGGGAALLGDPYGSKLTLGFESIETFGTRFYSRVDLMATNDISFAPVVEVTNMPSADRYGVRLLGEVAANVGDGFLVAVRGGYQARDAASGGPSFGTTLGYAF